MSSPELHAKDGLPLLPFASASAFEQWLEQHGREGPGLWLKLAKKSSGIASVTYDEAVDVALCFGWIDGQKGAYDADWFLQRFTPRRPRSIWSKINTQRVRALTESDRMRPAGLAEVDRAKADGRWEAAYGGSRDIEVPADLRDFLDRSPTAARFWDTLTKSQRYSFLFRLQTAKRPETRAKRFSQFTKMLQDGKRL